MIIPYHSTKYFLYDFIFKASEFRKISLINYYSRFGLKELTTIIPIVLILVTILFAFLPTAKCLKKFIYQNSINLMYSYFIISFLLQRTSIYD